MYDTAAILQELMPVDSLRLPKEIVSLMLKTEAACLDEDMVNVCRLCVEIRRAARRHMPESL